MLRINLQAYRLYYIFAAVLTVFGIISIVILTGNLTAVNPPSMDALNLVLQNWKKRMVMDITTFRPDDGETCEDQGLFATNWEHIWPGSRTSCDCRLSDIYSLKKYDLSNKIYWEPCNFSMFMSSCKFTEAQPEKKLIRLAYQFESTPCFVRDDKWNFKKLIKNWDELGACQPK